MEYQEIATKYKEKSLDTYNLERGLDEAKPLEARSRYRAVSTSGRLWYYGTAIVDLLTIQEDSRKSKMFKSFSTRLIEEYFNELIERLRNGKAWDVVGIKARDYSKERFQNASIDEKFAIIYELNNKYSEFLEVQKFADLRGMFTGKKADIDDSLLLKMEFIRLMFEALKSDDVKKGFYCFDEKYLSAVLKYKTSKEIRLEDYMKKQKKPIFDEYQRLSTFFSMEDYRDIIENINLTSTVSKMPKTEVMRVFFQMSETEAEKNQLETEKEWFKDLEEKYYQMEKLDLEALEKRRIEEERKNRIKLEADRKRQAEEAEKQRILDEQRAQEEKERAERERIIGSSEGYTGELDRRIEAIQNIPTAKETVIPFIFSWFDKEDVSLTRKLGSKRLKEFFDKIKKIESKAKARVSLLLITNADEEVTKKRVEELKQKAKEAGLPRLIEGAFGGYSSFRIDEYGNIRELSRMSQENREKIKLLLEHSIRYSLPVSIIDENEQNYLRYKFSDGPDECITMPYLKVYVANLLKDKNVKKQPLRFNPFIEKKASGIDVLLESQLKGISKVHEYYDSKYHIIQGRSYKVDIEKIDEFLSKEEQEPDVR